MDLDIDSHVIVRLLGSRMFRTVAALFMTPVFLGTTEGRSIESQFASAEHAVSILVEA